MARRRVNKSQVAGESWLSRKYNAAAIQHTPVSVDTNDTTGRWLFAVPILAIVIGLAFSFLQSKINPDPSQGEAGIMATQEGGLYVRVEDAIHPVTNMASARLIVGSPDKATVVKEKDIANQKRGPLIGIPSAPSMTSFWDDESAAWGVCEWQDRTGDLSLTNTDTYQTSLVAGKETWGEADTLDERRAMLVRPTDSPDEVWLLFRDRRAQIATDDYSTQSALGITKENIANAKMVNRGFLNSIQTLPVLSAPELKRMGESSDKVDGYRVGDVMVTGNAEGSPIYFAVTPGGVQRVTSLIADLLLNKGGRRSEVSDQRVIANAPQSDEITISNYPDSAPEIVEAPAVCYSWARPRGATAPAAAHIVYGMRIPVNDEASERVQEFLPDVRGSSSAATNYATKNGKGWYVRVTGNAANSSMEGQIAYISDNGVWYNLVPDTTGDYTEVTTALGFEGDPLPIPDSIAQMFPKGPDLSRQAAMVEHVHIPVDINDGEGRGVGVGQDLGNVAPRPRSIPSPDTGEPEQEETTSEQTTTQAPSGDDRSKDEAGAPTARNDSGGRFGPTPDRRDEPESPPAPGEPTGTSAPEVTPPPIGDGDDGSSGQ